MLHRVEPHGVLHISEVQHPNILIVTVSNFFQCWYLFLRQADRLFIKAIFDDGISLVISHTIISFSFVAVCSREIFGTP